LARGVAPRTGQCWHVTPSTLALTSENSAQGRLPPCARCTDHTAKLAPATDSIYKLCPAYLAFYFPSHQVTSLFFLTPPYLLFAFSPCRSQDHYLPRRVYASCTTAWAIILADHLEHRASGDHPALKGRTSKNVVLRGRFARMSVQADIALAGHVEELIGLLLPSPALKEGRTSKNVVLRGRFVSILRNLTYLQVIWRFSFNNGTSDDHSTPMEDRPRTESLGCTSPTVRWLLRNCRLDCQKISFSNGTSRCSSIAAQVIRGEIVQDEPL
jgi:hypothetical protein